MDRKTGQLLPEGAVTFSSGSCFDRHLLADAFVFTRTLNATRPGAEEQPMRKARSQARGKTAKTMLGRTRTPMAVPAPADFCVFDPRRPPALGAGPAFEVSAVDGHEPIARKGTRGLE